MNSTIWGLGYMQLKFENIDSDCSTTCIRCGPCLQSGIWPVKPRMHAGCVFPTLHDDGSYCAILSGSIPNVHSWEVLTKVMSMLYNVYNQPSGLQRICCRTSISIYISFSHLRGRKREQGQTTNSQASHWTNRYTANIWTATLSEWACVV